MEEESRVRQDHAIDRAELHGWHAQLLERFSDHGLIDLDRLLLPDDDPVIISQLEEDSPGRSR
eukprot:5055487-Pyramimonas_sp.AAC.1